MNAPLSAHVANLGVPGSEINSPDKEIKKMWPSFGAAGRTPLSLRAIPPKGAKPILRVINKTFNANDYPNIEDRKRAFEAEALRLNDLGYNVYIVMNSIRPSFCGDAVCDSDIENRVLLLIDFDRAGKAKVPASDTEVADARRVADLVAEYLSAQGWDEPIRVMSGNGHHLYYHLDHLPNDDKSKDAIQSLLNWLAAKFDSQSTHIDTGVYNASRITKIPGTIARKGLESEGRPYRMARVLCAL
jgi:hypothetical protein